MVLNRILFDRGYILGFIHMEELENHQRNLRV